MRLIVALTLAIAPITSGAYYLSTRLLLSGTDAARFIGGGSSIHQIDTTRIDAYYRNLRLASLFGVFCAFLLALEIARAFKRAPSGNGSHSE